MKLSFAFASVIALAVVGCASGYEVGASGNDPPDPTFRTGDTADPPDPTFRPDYDAGKAPIPDAAVCNEGYSYCTSDAGYKRCVNGAMVDIACGGGTKCVNQTVNSGGAALPSAQCTAVTLPDGGPTPPNICAVGVKKTCAQSYDCCLKSCTLGNGVVPATCLSVCKAALKTCQAPDPTDPGGGGCKGKQGEDDDDEHHQHDDKEHKALKH